MSRLSASRPRTFLYNIFVGQYYQRNAGFFLFFFLFFFGIVAPSQQIAYHYALIRGILSTPPLLIIVFFIWLLYASKCSQWIIGLLHSPDHNFLYLLPLLGKAKTFRLLLEVQMLLYLPITFYAIAIMGVGLQESAGVTAILVGSFVVAVCLASAILYQYALFYPGRLMKIAFLRAAANGNGRRRKHIPYWSLLLRGFIAGQKMLLTGIKLFGCGILYLLLKIQTPEDYDIRMPFLVFSLAIFGHGILIYQARSMEEQQLLFYRSMPVPLFRRFLQYMILYLLVMTPEIITIGWLMPDHIRILDALGFVLAGSSTLLLLNSCLFMAALQKSDFLKLTLLIFGILYFGVLSDHLILLSGLFLLTAGSLFFRGYCRWEG